MGKNQDLLTNLENTFVEKFGEEKLFQLNALMAFFNMNREKTLQMSEEDLIALLK